MVQISQLHNLVCTVQLLVRAPVLSHQQRTSSGSNIPLRVTMICFGCSSTGRERIRAATSSAVFHFASCQYHTHHHHDDQNATAETAADIEQIRNKNQQRDSVLFSFYHNTFISCTLCHCFVFLSLHYQLIYLFSTSTLLVGQHKQHNTHC